MTEPKATLAERLRRLQALRSSPGQGSISTAEPLAGDWPHACQVFPASYAQSRLWFLHQLQPNLTTYHLPAFWHLNGELNLNALSQALAALIERHPTLRSSFQLQGSELLQLLHPPAPYRLEVELLGKRDLDAVIRAWQQEEASTPFDLTSGLLLRSRLLQVAADEHILLINHHHIASDSWSESVLSRDLAEFYNAYRSGRASKLPPLRVHYHDYAAWQRQRLSGDRLQQLRDYWIPKLTGLPPLDLPTDHPRPAIPSHQEARHSFSIQLALIAPFEEFCRSEGATLQMGLLALLALILHRYSRQDDLAIGISIWGRNHPDLEPLIGFFINTLPIRIHFSADLSFRQLLAQIKTTSINAYDHQELPFEQIVEALNPERDVSCNPLVQVMLQLIEPEPNLDTLDRVKVAPLLISENSLKVDLGWQFRRNARGGLTGTASYSLDLFKEEKIEGLASSFLALLEDLKDDYAGKVNLPANELRIITKDKEAQVLAWSRSISRSSKHTLIHQFVMEGVSRSEPSATAVKDAKDELSYQDLIFNSHRLANRLIGEGVKPGDRVGILLPRRVELPVALLGVLIAGGCYVAIDPAYPDKQICRRLKDAMVTVCISTPDIKKRITGFCHITLELHQPRRPESNSQQEHRELDTEEYTPTVSEDDSAYLIYTSGSTGDPKGVEVTHKAAMQMLNYRLDYLTPQWACRVVPFFSSISFDASIAQIFTVLAAGGCLAMLDTIEELKTMPLCENTTHLSGTPGAIRNLIENDLMPQTTKVIGLGGEAIDAGLCEMLRSLPSLKYIYIVYGITEAGGFSTALRIDRDKITDLAKARNNIGSPIIGVQAYITDRRMHLLPPGIPGELHIGGSGLARGYLNNPELTAQKFIPDPFSDDPSARLYKSGDLASWNPDGTLAFHGRIDQQIKLRGFRIEPAEIEANLLAHPAVAQAVIVLRHDDPANPRLIAYWVPQQTADDSPSSDQLRSFLAQRLPDYMVPSAFVALETLPLTTNGKLDRKALPAPSFAGALDQRVEPSTDVERQLHAIWAEVLGHSDFGITDNFFLVGGHSLAAARLVSRLEQTIGSAPALAALFHNPTIAGLVQLMQGAVSGLSPSLVTLQPKGERPPLFVIHGWGGTVWGFVDLARALAPDRPVYGLQAPGVEWQRPPQGSVREMAAGYAEQILQMRPEGMIHLVGYSAGGWYAHAVAEALLERGAVVGLFAVMDTHATAQIHRRIGLFLLLEQLYSRFGKSVAGLLNLSGEESRFGYLQGRVRALKALLDRYLHIGGEGSMTANEAEGVQGSSDPFVLLLKHGYRPRRLPIKVAVFAPKPGLDRLWFLWRFYARAGVSLYPMFSDHFDFYRPELMDELAASLESALKRVELPSV